MTMKLVLIRHGESEWNKLNLFTGWTDVDLSEAGRREAVAGGRTRRRGLPLAYTLDRDMNVLDKRYIGDADTIARKIDAVAKQGTTR